MCMYWHHGSWTKRSVGFPRGFLLYGVLKILDQKPMSGSELMEEIENRTGWKPSPGSIYPLLGRLQGEGFVEEIQSDEPGLKRFKLTDKGQTLLAEHDNRREVFRRKLHSMRRLEHMLHRELDEDLYQSSTKLLESLEKISPLLRGEKTKEAKEKIRSILTRATGEVEEMRKSFEPVDKGS
jgi:DNA-binding PadR family transcriptional regulator